LKSILTFCSFLAQTYEQTMAMATASVVANQQQQQQVPMIQGVSFNPETDIKYSKLKINSSGGKSVGIVNAHTGQTLYVGTPLLLTWGIQEFVDDKTKKVSYDMALQFPSDEYHQSAESKADSNAFLKAMVAFEKKLKADALANSKDWFAKPKMTPDAIDALFTPVLKYPVDKLTCEKDTSKAPTMKIKVPFWNNKWEGVEVYDANKLCLFPSSNPAVSPKDLITKQSHVVTMIQCGGLWFANGKFGVTWRLVQGIVQPKLSMRGRCHLSLTPSESVRLQSEADKQQQQQQFSDDDDVSSSVPVTETVDSDDGDESEEDDGGLLTRMPSLPVAAPPVQPQSVASAEAPKKKIIKKTA
jgi:hypothetical protein